MLWYKSSSTTVLKSDNKNVSQQIRIISDSEESCDNENWSNDAKM